MDLHSGAGMMQLPLIDALRSELLAPDGYTAVPKSDAKPRDGSNICRACDWRPTCQMSDTDFSRAENRCMSWAREDGVGVVFKRPVKDSLTVDLRGGRDEAVS